MTYLLCQVKDTTLRFFGQNGQPLLSRHPLNDRKQTQVTESYISKILQEGCVAGVRGICVAVESNKVTMGDHAQEPEYWLLSWGTLTEAVYEAYRREPRNIMVKASVDNGITGCVILSARTPHDVLIWIRDYMNSFHYGSKYSFTELLKVRQFDSCQIVQTKQKSHSSTHQCLTIGGIIHIHY